MYIHVTENVVFETENNKHYNVFMNVHVLQASVCGTLFTSPLNVVMPATR